MNESQMRGVSIEELLMIGRIGRSTYRYLVKRGLRTLFDISKYHNSIVRLLKPSSDVSKEITALMDFINNGGVVVERQLKLFQDTEGEQPAGVKLFESMTEDERTLMRVSFERHKQNLYNTYGAVYTRFANVLNTVGYDVFVRNFLLEDDTKMMMVKDVGQVSLSLVADIKEKLRQELQYVRNGEQPLDYRIFVNYYGGLMENDDFILNFSKKHGHLPFFYILQAQILAQLNQDETKAFLNRYDVFGGQVETDKTKINRTSYTISTYAINVYDALFTPGVSANILGKNITKMMADKSLWAYLHQKFQDVLYDENHPVVKSLIRDEKLFFVPKFILTVVGKLLSSNYSVLGGFLKALTKTKEKQIDGCYLHTNKLPRGMVLKDELAYFHNEVYLDNLDNLDVDMVEFVKKRRNHQQDTDEEIATAASIMTKVLVNEYGFVVNEKGKLRVPKQKNRSLPERLYILLSKNNREPMLLARIVELINAEEGRKYVKATISLALNRDSRFVSSGKKGYYALTEWNLPYFGGNIDIVMQVLKEYGQPMKGEQVVEVLSKYSYNANFNKNDLSAVVSLSKDKIRRFGLGLYGLNEWEFPDLPEKRETVSPFQRSWNEMTQFLNTHGRVPSYNGDHKERTLYRWWMRMKRKAAGKNNWTEERLHQFQELAVLHEKVRKDEAFGWLRNSTEKRTDLPNPTFTPDWNECYQQVKDFIKQNIREPFADFPLERDMASWLAEQKACCRADNISPERKELIYQLRDMLW